MNLLIKKGQPNLIALTLQEKSDPLVGNNFLFQFTNDQNNQKIRTQIPLTSSNDRYDLFTLIEGTTVTFPIKGDYKYEVFQMPNSGSIDPSEGVLVEVGKLEFEDDATELPAPTNDTVIAVYERD